MSTPRRLAYRFYQGFWTGLDWIFPPQCGGCGVKGARWCPDCQQGTQVISASICPCCGQLQANAGLCFSCRKNPPHYSAVRSWAAFRGPLRQAIHSLKYKRNVGLGEILSRQLLERLETLKWPVDLVAPVPLGVARLAERGYNQADLIARPLAMGMGISYKPRALSKTRDTRSQVDLSAAQRRQNVSGAFHALAELVKNQRILLVDDVMTSGATLDACAAACLDAGAQQVYGMTLARAILDSPVS